MKIQISTEQMQYCVFTTNPAYFSVIEGQYAHMTQPFAEVPEQVIERWRKAEELFADAQAEMQEIYDKHWVEQRKERCDHKDAEQHIGHDADKGDFIRCDRCRQPMVYLSELPPDRADAIRENFKRGSE